MAGTKGRRSSRKRRGGGAEETDQDSCHYSDNTISQQSSKDQEILSSPVFSRYPTRRSRAAFAQSATLPSPLRNPLRSIKRTPSHSSSLNPTMRILSETHDEPLSGNRDNKLLDLDNPTLELISQCRGPREVQQTAPLAASHQDLLDSYRPSRENYVVSHGDDRPEKSTNSQCLSRCNSLNITEFAKRLQDDLDDDPEEVESAFDPAFDCINGHRVKVEIAPLLRVIFEKYGDITNASDVKSSNILSFFLERLCDIYERLERTTFFDVTHLELNDMLDEVRFFEHEKLNVGWLREKLEYISQTKISFQEYLSFKEEEAKYDVSIGNLEKGLEVYQNELSDLHQKISLVQQKISVAEEELVANKAKADQIKKVALDIKARVNTLRKQTLVHGLL